MKAGTTFYFVTDGIQSAYAQARQAANTPNLVRQQNTAAVDSASRYRNLVGTPYRDKAKLMTRVRRIQGQAAALEKQLAEENDCIAVLQQIADSGSRQRLDGSCDRRSFDRSSRQGTRA
jgi:hypothetical protein